MWVVPFDWKSADLIDARSPAGGAVHLMRRRKYVEHCGRGRIRRRIVELARDRHGGWNKKGQDGDVETTSHAGSPLQRFTLSGRDTSPRSDATSICRRAMLLETISDVYSLRSTDH